MARLVAANRVAVANRYTPISAPTDISGCIAYYDASDVASITKDGGNLVSQWADKSGNANHLVQASGTLQPLYDASSTVGVPTVVFNGSDNYMQATFTLPQPWTIIAGVRILTVSPGVGSNDILWDGKNNVSGAMVVAAASAGSSYNINGGANLTVCAAGVDIPLTALSYCVPWNVFNSTSSAGGIDELQYRSGNAGTSAAGGITLGTLGAGTAARCYHAEFSKVAVYNVALSLAQIRRVVRWVRGE